MKKKNLENLKNKLAKHSLWLNDAGGERLCLSSANLYDADLSRANLTYADLSRANLTGADLSGANLTYADLTGANLTYADLTGANLTGANLTYANLYGANLTGADLSGADLSDVKLRNTVGNSAEVQTIQTTGYTITLTDERMQIGCQSHRIADWMDFPDCKIALMAYDALNWWIIWKPIIKSILKTKCKSRNENDE